MQGVAVELVARLRDAIGAIKDHFAELDDLNLRTLEDRLPNGPAGSAEMVVRVLIYREMESRKRT